MALISDAGTPGISDPGFLLVRAGLEAGIRVECLPGATALIPALVASGYPSDRFVFEGFLPQKKGRQTRLQALAEERLVHRHELRYISAARVALRTSMLSASMKRTMLSPLGSIRTWFPPAPDIRGTSIVQRPVSVRTVHTE